MDNLYNIFNKKKIEATEIPTIPAPEPEKTEITTFLERFKKCMVRAEKEGYCDCDICLDKVDMSNKLFDIVRYLCKNYTETTGNKMYVADALEIVLVVAGKLKTELQ